MPELDRWFAESLDRWNANKPAGSFAHGYWAIGFKFSPVDANVTLQIVGNAIVTEDNNGSPFQTIPDINRQLGDRVEINKDLAADVRYWCATRTGEVFFLQRYAEDHTNPGHRMQPDIMSRNVNAVLSMMPRLAAIYAKEAKTLDYHAEWKGLAGRDLYVGNSFDSIDDTAIADPQASVGSAALSADVGLLRAILRPFHLAFGYDPDESKITEWLSQS
jgi:hypothetical protein